MHVPNIFIEEAGTTRINLDLIHNRSEVMEGFHGLLDSLRDRERVYPLLSPALIALEVTWLGSGLIHHLTIKEVVTFEHAIRMYMSKEDPNYEILLALCAALKNEFYKKLSRG